MSEDCPYNPPATEEECNECNGVQVPCNSDHSADYIPHSHMAVSPCSGNNCSNEELCIHNSVGYSIEPGYIRQYDVGLVCCDSEGNGADFGDEFFFGRSYDLSLTKCTDAGLRLCTIEEIKAGAGETASFFVQNQLVWTNEPCGEELNFEVYPDAGGCRDGLGRESGWMHLTHPPPHSPQSCADICEGYNYFTVVTSGDLNCKCNDVCVDANVNGVWTA